jgi:3-deoxy-D-manno-octulosonate 8-phosphate phosphatase (KDO 8-P phosphatase)
MRNPIKLSLVQRIRRIKMVIFDVDGVLTNGAITLDAHGEESKTFNVIDGTGIFYLGRAGLVTAILSGRAAKAVDYRSKELEVRHVLQGYKKKLDGFKELLEKTGIGEDEVCYIGDDLPDIPVMRRVGFAVAVASAQPEVIDVAHWVTKNPGGSGAARELAEKILKVQRKWPELLARYFQDAETPPGEGKR